MRKAHLCRKPENAIFKSQKPGKIGNMVEFGKHHLKFAETGKVFLEAAELRKAGKA